MGKPAADSMVHKAELYEEHDKLVARMEDVTTDKSLTKLKKK